MLENLRRRPSGRSQNPSRIEGPSANSSSEIESQPSRRRHGHRNLLEKLTLFDNRMKDSYQQELVDAEKLESEVREAGHSIGPGPYRAGTDEFSRFIDDQPLNQKFKWILDKNKRLVVIDVKLKHSVAAKGKAVATAGHAQFTGNNQLLIDNDTGHYHTTFRSLNKSFSNWQQEGYTVQKKKRVDLAAALRQKKKCCGIM